MTGLADRVVLAPAPVIAGFGQKLQNHGKLPNPTGRSLRRPGRGALKRTSRESVGVMLAEIPSAGGRRLWDGCKKDAGRYGQAFPERGGGSLLRGIPNVSRSRYRKRAPTKALEFAAKDAGKEELSAGRSRARAFGHEFDHIRIFPTANPYFKKTRAWNGDRLERFIQKIQPRGARADGKPKAPSTLQRKTAHPRFLGENLGLDAIGAPFLGLQ